MKKVIFCLTLCVVAFWGCKQVDPVKTLENLHAAYIGESTASAKYASFAKVAMEAGNNAVAVLFLTASKSEAIHAANHLKVLEGLGHKADQVNPEYTPGDVLSNLRAALEGESYEVATMYPEFIAAAKTEKVKKAVKSFNWAMDTEKKHMVFYENAIKALTDNTEAALPTGYAICPICGNTYDAAAVDDKCAFCQTPKKDFVIIQ